MAKRSLNVLSVLRQKAVDAVLKSGLSQKEACKLFGFSPTSMTKYIRAYKKLGQDSFSYEKRGVKSGDRNLLTPSQESSLVDTLL